MGGAILAFSIIAFVASYLEARGHRLQYLLYGYPVKERIVDGIPIMQYTTEQGWNNCLEQMEVDVDIVFYGNSITKQSNFRKYFPDRKICNLGIGGDDLNGLYRRIEMIRTVHPEKVFVMGGINDSKWIHPDTFSVQYERMLRSMRDSLPAETDIFIQSLLPVNHKVYDKYADNMKIKRLNEIIKSISTKYKTRYIDLYSLYEENGEMPDSLTIDGIHLKPYHYKKWADAISTFIYETEHHHN